MRNTVFNFNMSTFSTEDAVRYTGISKDMLNYLCRIGVVVPTASRGLGKRGYGVHRRYSFTDLISFKVVKKLTVSGVSPVKVRKAIRDLHGMGITIHKLPSTHVVIFEQSVYKWDGKGDPWRLSDGQKAFGFILDLESIREELVADIARCVA